MTIKHPYPAIIKTHTTTIKFPGLDANALGLKGTHEVAELIMAQLKAR